MPTCGKARAWRGRGMIGGRARKRTREARTHEWRSSSPAEWAGLIGDAERRDQRCSIGDGAGMSEASMRASKSVMYCKSRLQLSAERRLPLSAPSHGPLAPAGHAPVRGADRAARQRHLGHPLLPSALKAENPVGPVDTRLREGAGASRAHCERRSRPGMAGEAVGGRGAWLRGKGAPCERFQKAASARFTSATCDLSSGASSSNASRSCAKFIPDAPAFWEHTERHVGRAEPRWSRGAREGRGGCARRLLRRALQQQLAQRLGRPRLVDGRGWRAAAVALPERVAGDDDDRVCVRDPHVPHVLVLEQLCMPRLQRELLELRAGARRRAVGLRPSRAGKGCDYTRIRAGIQRRARPSPCLVEREPGCTGVPSRSILPSAASSAPLRDPRASLDADALHELVRRHALQSHLAKASGTLSAGP